MFLKHTWMGSNIRPRMPLDILEFYDANVLKNKVLNIFSIKKYRGTKCKV